VNIERNLMIKGIGLDVVNVQRMRHWHKFPNLFKRFFHPEELSSSLNKQEQGLYSLAARFAAKEAFGKALGTGLKGFSLRDICVMNNSQGKPEMYLYGSAEKIFNARGGGKIFTSLTHEHDYALALVVIEGENG